MKKLILLAGVAAMAMPVSAYATTPPYEEPCYSCGDGDWDSTGSFNEDTDIDVEYDNKLDVSIEVNVDYDKYLDLKGDVSVHGRIDVNSSAVAVSDPKLIVEKNDVDGGWREWDLQDIVKARGFHSTDNSTTINEVKGNGYVGVNAVAGQNNIQANTGALATATGGNLEDESEAAKIRPGYDPKLAGNAGWAEASTIALQKVWDNDFDAGKTNNVADVKSVKGDGSIGVNAASGAFNNQANILTMAVVKDGALAEANSGVLLISLENDTTVATGSTNTTDVGCIDGNGNVGVNVATGVGNIQHNSLTIATTVN